MPKPEAMASVKWLVNDARYLARQARIYRSRGGAVNIWLADMVRANAAHSLSLARQYKAGHK